MPTGTSLFCISMPLSVARTAGRLAIGLFLLASIGCREEGPTNVLLITIDTLRADRLGVYGYDQPVSPHIDALAARSTVFEECISPIGTTVPSHASMFTGLYPRAHDLRWNQEVLSKDLATLAERLSAEGFETAAFVGLRVLQRSVARGFEIKESAALAGELYPPAAETNTLFRDWLESRTGERPFFAWIHYFDPHSPYKTTPYSEERLAAYDGPFAEGIDVEEFTKSGWHKDHTLRNVVGTLYDASVLSTDNAVGAILDLLGERDLEGSTTIILTSDHGQDMGDHGQPGHGPLLWNSVLHVPLIVHDPRRPAARRVTERVSLVDLTPTVLDHLGLEIPEALQGRSLWPAIEGDRLKPTAVFAETRLPRSMQRPETPEEVPVAVFRGDLKLVDRPDGVALFDLSTDPDEIRPLDLRAGGRDDVDRLIELAAAFQSQEPRARSSATVSEEDRELLRSLGYVN